MINWKKLYEVYTRSGVNKSSFYRNHLPGYFEDGESLPTLSELYEQFALIEQKGSSCIVVGEEPFRQIKSLIEIGPGRFGKGISIAEQNSNT